MLSSIDRRFGPSVNKVSARLWASTPHQVLSTSLTEISVTSHSRATVEPPAWVMSVPSCSTGTYGTLESSTTVCESLRLDLNCKYDAIVSPDGGKINVTSLKLSGNAPFESLAAIPGIIYTEELRFTRSYSPK